MNSNSNNKGTFLTFTQQDIHTAHTRPQKRSRSRLDLVVFYIDLTPLFIHCFITGEEQVCRQQSCHCSAHTRLDFKRAIPMAQSADSRFSGRHCALPTLHAVRLTVSPCALLSTLVKRGTAFCSVLWPQASTFKAFIAFDRG